MIDAMTRHEVQVLRAAGIPERAVAQRTAVSVRSVERIAAAARTIVTSLVDDGCSAAPGKSGHSLALGSGQIMCSLQTRTRACAKPLVGLTSPAREDLLCRSMSLLGRIRQEICRLDYQLARLERRAR